MSGPDVPGEGEHKIAEFIRSLKSQQDYPPNLSHCIHGLDADLIMLSLMSHEPLFTLLREEVVLDQEPRWISDQRKLLSRTDQFQLMHISLLREYLALDIMSGIMVKKQPPKEKKQKAKNPYEFMEKDPDLVVKNGTAKSGAKKFNFFRLMNSKTFKSHLTNNLNFNVERLFDDFILFCCLAGNDFLPHLGFADIGFNGLDKLLNLYIDHLVSFTAGGGKQPWLLNEGGQICWSNFLSFLERAVELENVVLEEKVKAARWLSEKTGVLPNPTPSIEGDPLEDSDSYDSESGGPTVEQWYNKGHDLRSIQDQIAFHYWRKMGFDVQDGSTSSLEQRDLLLRSYLEGLQWTMLYYFHGVPSWSWYYPFHYAPFVTDLVEFLKPQIDTFTPTFDLGTPFAPFQQLMAVLPPLSSALVPAIYRPLMVEATSPIIRFYPSTFNVDREGVKVSWGGVTLLPFIDQDILVAAMAASDNDQTKLTDEERARNTPGKIHIYRCDKSSNTPLAMMALVSHKIMSIPEKRLRVPSSLPAYFSDVLGPRIPLRYSYDDASFFFRRIQCGIHQSKIPDDFYYPPYQPTFFNWNDVHTSTVDITGKPQGFSAMLPPQTPDDGAQTEGASEQSSVIKHAWARTSFAKAICQTRRIQSIERQKDVVRSFYRITRNVSLILTISPSFLTPKDCAGAELFGHVLRHLSAVVTGFEKKAGAQLDYDYSFLPTVRCSYPYRRVGKLLGIWFDDIGYIPLHQKSRHIEPNLYELFVADMKGIQPGWKLSKSCVDTVRNTLLTLLSRKGLNIGEAGDIAIDKDLQDKLTDVKMSLLNIKTLFASDKNARINKTKNTFNWREMMLEVMDIEEVAENLAGKPLIRHKQNQSRICFLPEVEFIDDNVTTDVLHQVVSGYSPKIGETVMCTADTSFFGAVGVVAEKAAHHFMCQFDMYESPEERYEYQKRLLESHQSTYRHDRWYRLDSLCKALRKSPKVLKKVLRKLTVRLNEGYEFADMGLGLIQDVKNPIDGNMEPVCIPGYSVLDDNNVYEFSGDVLKVLREFFQIWPRLEDSLMKLQDSDRVQLSHFFGDANISPDIQTYCVRRYLKWLNSQPFRAGGTCFRYYDYMSIGSHPRILDVVLKQAIKLSCVVPQTVWIKGAQNVLKQLHSPMVPVKKIKMLQLGQRVVVVKSGSLAPFGTRGVIMGLFPGSAEDNESELLAEIICEATVVGGQSVMSRYDSMCRRLRIPCRCLLPIPPVLHGDRLPPKQHFLEHVSSILKANAYVPGKRVLNLALHESEA
eukprot:Blabericola_migrator_1__1118@NODE_1286_length_4894_cov_92_707479_g390_i1_p1_GENE_NODE_1286_length_4894_cov_92_707479_g390_i1NODE_1286_length_4894_cov_92_707479_g390_i1_p1_ORF_typecomplete_len1495_score247_07XRN_N/PF03159_18/4_2e78XRN_M/PF17846_1/4e77SH3_12/PF18129_1/9_6e03SH3_12/PF18129_1/1_2e08S1like/PF14444_6/0_24S1like/PF14444_6/2_5e03_NODE_1286_length_4894_cov_92_707479_g390_i14094239